ncbi:SRPBCC family protein [Streptomyces sp. QHH-9511]|uniref:SRPBCC family protein n=1 Tax=Streptomyces sp. QHH-9511 TaxID=2684468 RepID=UPI0013177D47|nr:SRPBCC family protein [Streptomyces sp. QHH-9511]QGZ51269.1 SRPBCC family protein [Streptomyces sp. QHH-9511]
MAVRHQLIRRAPEAVWAVLADPSRYSDWVVGTSNSKPLDGDWPEVGSRLLYTVRIGPWSGDGETVVRRCVPGAELELEAFAKGIGSARIALDVRPWGEETLIICDEHPLRGLGGRWHNTLSDAVIQLRHRDMLGRLARTVENGTGEDRPNADRTDEASARAV